MGNYIIKGKIITKDKILVPFTLNMSTPKDTSNRIKRIELYARALWAGLKKETVFDCIQSFAENAGWKSICNDDYKSITLMKSMTLGNEFNLEIPFENGISDEEVLATTKDCLENVITYVQSDGFCNNIREFVPDHDNRISTIVRYVTTVKDNLRLLLDELK